MFDSLRKTLSFLTKSEKNKALILLFLMIVVAFFETAGVVSVMPFLAVLATPEIIETNKWLHKLYQFLGFADKKDFLFFLGGVVFLLVLFGNFTKAIYAWTEARYVNMRGHYLSKRLLENYLKRPYIFFVSRNSGELAKNVLDETGKIISLSLKQFMAIASKTMVNIFVISILIISSPLLALIMSVMICVIYLFIYKRIKNRLVLSGKDVVKANKERYIIINEAFGGIKDLKLLGLEVLFLKLFNKPSLKRAKYEAFYQAGTAIPQYILDTLTIGSALFATFYLMLVKGNLAEVLPILGLYAYSGKKIVPAMQEIFKAAAVVRYNMAIVDNIYNEFNDGLKEKEATLNYNEDTLGRLEKIELRNLSFKYPKTKKNIINGIDLTVEANKTIGLVGETGSGKTTLVDIILGLLERSSGAMLVNNELITQNNVRIWQNKLGYVPQNIFLLDDTIAQNIAFGIPKAKIDMEQVKKAAAMANLSDFIENELSEKYETSVGERGVRLSGGQRQRIGIARALYREPEVLILDEATSALDNITEKSVMNAINNLGGKKTVIIIAHRLSTIKNVDAIYFMSKGKIIASGKYDDLIKTNEEFAKMAKAK